MDAENKRLYDSFFFQLSQHETGPSERLSIHAYHQPNPTISALLKPNKKLASLCEMISKELVYAGQ